MKKKIYEGVSHTEVIPIAGALLNVLSGNPSILENMYSLLPTEAKLKGSLDRCRVANGEALDRDPAKLVELEQASKDLNLQLNMFHWMADMVSVQDPNIHNKLGLPKPQPQTKRNYHPLDQQARQLSLRYGKEHVILAKASAVKFAKSYEISVCEGDPLVEENWRHHATYGVVNRMEIRGLIPGKLYSFRVRAIFSNGAGPWSNYVTLMAI